jgi:hypothetical protein
MFSIVELDYCKFRFYGNSYSGFRPLILDSCLTIIKCNQYSLKAGKKERLRQAYRSQQTQIHFLSGTNVGRSYLNATDLLYLPTTISFGFQELLKCVSSCHPCIPGTSV